jgi:hypothetical protein
MMSRSVTSEGAADTTTRAYPLTAEFTGVEVTVLKGVVNLSQFDVALLINETSITAYLFRAIQWVIKIVRRCRHWWFSGKT